MALLKLFLFFDFCTFFFQDLRKKRAKQEQLAMDAIHNAVPPPSKQILSRPPSSPSRRPPSSPSRRYTASPSPSRPDTLQRGDRQKDKEPSGDDRFYYEPVEQLRGPQILGQDEYRMPASEHYPHDRFRGEEHDREHFRSHRSSRDNFEAERQMQGRGLEFGARHREVERFQREGEEERYRIWAGGNRIEESPWKGDYERFDEGCRPSHRTPPYTLTSPSNPDTPQGRSYQEGTHRGYPQRNPLPQNSYALYLPDRLDVGQERRGMQKESPATPSEAKEIARMYKKQSMRFCFL